MFCTLRVPYHIMVQCNCSVIYAHKESMPFPVPIKKKLRFSQHSVQVSCTKFHPKQTTNVEVQIQIHLCHKQNIAFTAPVFKKLMTSDYNLKFFTSPFSNLFDTGQKNL